jgi:itaconate CoA-transferase
MTMRPLDGITVITLEHAVSAPLATRHLADLGARVIKIERPGAGDFARGYDRRARGLASYFVWVNRSKESLTLDVKHPEARAILMRLIERADVVVQNLAPGAAARLGLSFEALRPGHPRLIVCDVSGYGLDGPYRDKKAYDMLIQAESGLMSVTGTPEQPSRTGVPIADIAAGTYAYSSILAALIERGRTGQGCHIDLSMLEALCEWMGYPLYYTLDGGTPPARTGAAHATIAPYGPFATGDGKTVFLGLQNEREWESFCRVVLERPELAADSRFEANTRRAEHRAELAAIVNEAFATLTAAQVIERLEKAQIANARLNEMHEVWAHPQLQARGRWREVSSSVGALPALLPPGRIDAFEARMDPIPALGEHTNAILEELGFAPAEIASLRAEGAI